MAATRTPGRALTTSSWPRDCSWIAWRVASPGTGRPLARRGRPARGQPQREVHVRTIAVDAPDFLGDLSTVQRACPCDVSVPQCCEETARRLVVPRRPACA